MTLNCVADDSVRRRLFLRILLFSISERVKTSDFPASMTETRYQRRDELIGGADT